jgi:hypothetical protein
MNAKLYLEGMSELIRQMAAAPDPITRLKLYATIKVLSDELMDYAKDTDVPEGNG